MSGNKLEFRVTKGELDGHGRVAAPTAKVYFNDEHVATIGTGQGQLPCSDPESGGSVPCPTLDVTPLFHSVVVVTEG